MPKISERGIEMPASPIRRLVPFAESAKAKGIKVIHLNIGQPDIQTPEVAIAAVKAFDFKVVEYSHSAGNESYRRKLSEYYKSKKIDVNYNDILVTTGGSEAFLFAFLACLNPGDEIIVPEPFYANYNAFAVIAGIKIVPITSSIEDGFALPSINEFEKKITPRTKGILICNPNNPTGYLYSEKEFHQLRNIILKHDLYLFCDEVYREFCYDGKSHFSSLHLQGVDDNVVLIDSVSKRYSECGLRIGALISKNKKVIEAALKIGQSRLSPPLFGQIAAEASLDTPPEYFTEVYEEYLSRRDVLIAGLNSIPGVYTPTPQGSFYTLARLPIYNSDNFCQWILSDFQYEGKTVMMAPATGFYCTQGLGLNEVRIAYVLKKEDLIEAVEVLRKALEVYPGRVELKE